jgi:hypothetical protein
MMRDINNKPENYIQDTDYGCDIDIPMPSSCMMDMGISIGGNFSSFKCEEELK